MRNRIPAARPRVAFMALALISAAGSAAAAEGGFSYVMGLGGQSFRYE